MGVIKDSLRFMSRGGATMSYDLTTVYNLCDKYFVRALQSQKRVVTGSNSNDN